MKHKQNTADAADERQYPGAGHTLGNSKKQDSCLERQYTRQLNNNPRSDSNQ